MCNGPFAEKSSGATSTSPPFLVPLADDVKSGPREISHVPKTGSVFRSICYRRPKSITPPPPTPRLRSVRRSFSFFLAFLASRKTPTPSVRIYPRRGVRLLIGWLAGIIQGGETDESGNLCSFQTSPLSSFSPFKGRRTDMLRCRGYISAVHSLNLSGNGQFSVVQMYAGSHPQLTHPVFRSRSDGTAETGRGKTPFPSAPPGGRRRACGRENDERESERSDHRDFCLRSRSTSAVNDHFREDNLPCRPPTQSYNPIQIWIMDGEKRIRRKIAHSRNLSTRRINELW